MKILIVYHSFHHGNTKKIASVIAEETKAVIKPVLKTNAKEIKDYDLIGFGSGIYYMKHSSEILDFVRKAGRQNGKNAFIFSTSGLGFSNTLHLTLRNLLIQKGYKVAGEWGCRGLDTVGALKLMGGINKGRPDKKDIQKARKFACWLTGTLTSNMSGDKKQN